MMEKKFGASIGDILKSKQEPGKKPGADASSDKPETGKPEFVNIKLEDLGLSQGASIKEIVEEMEKRGMRPASVDDLVDSGLISEEKARTEYSEEEMKAFENMREVLNRLSFAKRSKEGLTLMELSDLGIVLAQLKDIATERYGLEANEYYAIFQESLDAKTGLPSLVSREKGRKIIIMDRQAKVKPASGKRYKVRVVKDTAPGQTHGVMFVELVEAGN